MGFFSRRKQRATGAASTGSVGIDREFAFVDVETTGLDPMKDRVIEIGMVVTDSRGNTFDEWSTLVNPGIGVHAGPTRIHGIETEWLAAAPPFGAIRHEIGRRIKGRIVVAHNTAFDCNFLTEEFTRAGCESSGDWSVICTLDLADKLGLPKRLPSACASLGIPHATHDALGDARACALMFHRFMTMIDARTFAGVEGATIGTVPLDGPIVTCIYRGEAREATRARPVLGQLLDSLPPHDSTYDRDPHASGAYLTALEDAVADGYVSPEEIHALGRVAHRMRLSGEEVRDLHHELILGLIDTALEDRRMSKSEREEIERVATWLGVDLSDWDAMVKAARKRVKVSTDQFRTGIAGQSIVFSGAGVHPPTIREAFAAKYAFSYATRVGEDTDLLVIGTAETDTAQVAKARDGGVPIMVESVFWQKLGEL